MQLILKSTALFAACVLGGFSQEGTSPKQYVPKATQVEPNVVKPGEIVTIRGVGLGSTQVEEVFLTDLRFDLKVKVMMQSDTEMKIRIPPFAKPGRQQVMMLTTAKPTQAYLEMPVYLMVEADEPVAPAAAKEIASARTGTK